MVESHSDTDRQAHTHTQAQWGVFIVMLRELAFLTISLKAVLSRTDRQTCRLADRQTDRQEDRVSWAS